MPNESTAAEQAAFAEQQRQLQADRDALEAERAEIAAERKAAADAAFAAHKSQCQSFVAGLVDSGRILPRFKDSLAAALTELPPGTEVEFSEGDGTKKAEALAVVREVLESLPKAMQYGQEMSTPAAETPAAAASFSVPEGMEVDAEGLAHYGRAQAYMQKHQCDYLTAVRATVAN